jgi:hypothetical protein
VYTEAGVRFTVIRFLLWVRSEYRKTDSFHSKLSLVKTAVRTYCELISIRDSRYSMLPMYYPLVD